MFALSNLVAKPNGYSPLAAGTPRNPSLKLHYTRQQSSPATHATICLSKCGLVHLPL